MSASFSVPANQVFSEIEKWLLRDGFDVVVDMEKSHGSHIIDAATGTDWLDFYTFFASAPFGMNHPKLCTEAFKEKVFRAAVNKVANSDIYTQEMAEFVKTFGEKAVPAGKGFKHLFFVDYGTLAIENAFKVAMDWKVSKLLAQGKITPGDAMTGRKGTKVIHFNEAFHGRGGYTLSVTNTADPNKHQRFAKFDWPRVINPKIAFPLEKNIGVVEWLEAQSLKQINQAIDNDPDGCCAIVIEGIQGEGGDNHFRPEFFQALRKIADERDLMLILDEVQSGMGITGKMWAWEHHGIVPDIYAFGKKSQVCGIAVTGRVDEVPGNCFTVSGRINSTWGGNVVDMVRATEYLNLYEEERVVDYVATTAGPTLLEGLYELQKAFPKHIWNARGKGLMCAFDICTPELRAKFMQACYKQHMLVLTSGTHSVRFRPALNVPVEDIKKGVEILLNAGKEVFN